MIITWRQHKRFASVQQCTARRHCGGGAELAFRRCRQNGALRPWWGRPGADLCSACCSNSTSVQDGNACTHAHCQSLRKHTGLNAHCIVPFQAAAATSAALTPPHQRPLQAPRAEVLRGCQLTKKVPTHNTPRPSATVGCNTKCLF